jgi:hypothetical protein
MKLKNFNSSFEKKSETKQCVGCLESDRHFSEFPVYKGFPEHANFAVSQLEVFQAFREIGNQNRQM